MQLKFKWTKLLMITAGILLFTFCEKDPELPDNLISFESNILGFPAADNEASIKIKFSYPAVQSGTIQMNAVYSGLEYNKDIVSDPVASGGVINIPYLLGEDSKTIKISKKAGVLFDGDEFITYTLVAPTTGLILGANPSIKLGLSEIIAPQAIAEIEGGGVTYPNRVFIDLSANRQTPIPRADWDLGFAAGSEFRVVLNSANGMLAYKTAKADINSVTAADSAGLSERLSLAAVFVAISLPSVPAWTSASASWIDDPSGNLSKTAIDEINAIDTANKVYIVNLGTGPGNPAPGLGWKKIKVNRKANGYLLQYADIAATSFSEITIVKDDKYNFQFIDFSIGIVNVEPLKDKWDIAWSGFTNLTNFGTGAVPYYFQDIILQNLNKVQSVQVLVATTAFESFNESNLNGLDFGVQSQIKIGSNWRSGGGPTSGPMIRTDRYYIIKDIAGNVYKLRFTALDSNGERGKPKFESILIKKA